MKHPCETLFELHGGGFSVGDTKGVCRITGKESVGFPFKKWVKDTFTDHGHLRAGDIISNDAAFCFVEDSALIQQKTGRDKPQKFRTYSHILESDGAWHCLTKADKAKIVEILQRNPKIVCLTDSGQKHFFFKHKIGFWQLDESYIAPDLEAFNFLHSSMMGLLELGFTQDEIKRGSYAANRILKVGIDVWQKAENKIKPHRGGAMFDFAAWLMFSKKEQ